MQLYWFEQTAADLPVELDWLSSGETVQLQKMRFAKRRNDWLLGRWTAKRAVATCLQLPEDLLVFQQIEILPKASGAPAVFLNTEKSTVNISLSHRAGVAACVAAPSPAQLGCDLELVEPRSTAFAADYFTAPEQDFVASAPPNRRSLLLNLLWSAKESALKALNTGLRLDTRDVAVDPCFGFDLREWNPLRVRRVGGSPFDGWWRVDSNMVRTVVSFPSSSAPVSLTLPGRALDGASRCA